MIWAILTIAVVYIAWRIIKRKFNDPIKKAYMIIEESESERANAKNPQ